MDDAVDAILVNEESKRKYLALAAHVNKLYWAILPDPDAMKFGELSALLLVFAKDEFFKVAEELIEEEENKKDVDNRSYA